MKKKRTGRRNRRILYVVLIIIGLLISYFGFKSYGINQIEKLGYESNDAALVFKECSNKFTCSKQTEKNLNDKIKQLEDQVLNQYGISKENFDPKHDESNYASKFAYKVGLETYLEELENKKQQAANQTDLEKAPPKIDVSEGGCFVNIVQGQVIANKKYCLPSTYAPGTNQTAKQNLDKMILDAQNQGITITISSGYRTYEEQVVTYQHWVNIYGQEYADTISAKPGYSEHQTGLVFDLNDGGVCNLEECFESTEAGIWLKNNAHKYGFIMRYLPGKESITGYAYEPWHFRYVGDIAPDIFSQNTTLEEYLNVQ